MITLADHVFRCLQTSCSPCSVPVPETPELVQQHQQQQLISVAKAWLNTILIFSEQFGAWSQEADLQSFTKLSGTTALDLGHPASILEEELDALGPELQPIICLTLQLANTAVTHKACSTATSNQQPKADQQACLGTSLPKAVIVWSIMLIGKLSALTAHCTGQTACIPATEDLVPQRVLHLTLAHALTILNDQAASFDSSEKSSTTRHTRDSASCDLAELLVAAVQLLSLCCGAASSRALLLPPGFTFLF